MKGGCILGFIASKIFSVIWNILKIIFTMLAKVIYYFGLYIPLIHLILSVIIYLALDYNVFLGGINTALYFFGLCLCIICSIIITIRNIIINPIQKYFIDRKVIEYTGKIHKGAPEPPKIYRSRVNPQIIVYEYENRYDLYEDINGNLKFISQEMKESKD